MADFNREDKTFEQLVTFTRASTGTYYDADGVLKTAEIDEPRLTYDPETGEALGLLIEEERTNLLEWSEGLDGTNWVKSETTVAPNDTEAPDGAPTADKLVENTTTGGHIIRQSSSVVPVAQGSTYTFSAYLAYAGRDGLLRFVDEDGSQVGAYFDLSAGSILLSSAGITATIEKGPAGFYRCSITYTFSDAITSGSTGQARIFTSQGTSEAYQGDGTSGIYIWGAQLEAGPFPTSYIKTEGSQVTRAVDKCSRVLGSEFNKSEGTFFLESEVVVQGSPRNYLTLMEDSGSGNRVDLAFAEGLVRFVEGGSVSFSATLPDPGIGKIKAAFSYSSDLLSISINGQYATTTVAESFSGKLTNIKIMEDWTGRNVDGLPPVKDIRYIPRALSATELEALTAP